MAWLPTTNDVNEGALGSQRVLKRSYPKSSELVLNSLQRYKWNKTRNIIRNLTPEKLGFLRKRARHLQSLKLQLKLTRAQSDYTTAVVEKKQAQDAIKLEKKRKATETLSKVQPVLEFDEIKISKMKNSELDLQLLWHRQFNQDLAKMKKAETRNKPEKMAVLKQAIEALNNREDRMDILAVYGPEDIN